MFTQVNEYSFTSHFTPFIWLRQEERYPSLFTRDVALLGKLTHSSVAQQNQQLTTARELITLLRSLGLMRSNADIAVQAYAFSAMVTGAAFVEQFLTDADRVPLEAQAEAVALLAQRTFEPDTAPDAATLRDVVAPAGRPGPQGHRGRDADCPNQPHQVSSCQFSGLTSAMTSYIINVSAYVTMSVGLCLR
jgi:hypothetical protein